MLPQQDCLCRSRGRDRHLRARGWWSRLLEAGSAKHGPALGRLERNRCLHLALRAHGSRLCPDSRTGACSPLRLALLTAFGIVLELLVVEEKLFTCCEYEIASAVHALQHLVDELHLRVPRAAPRTANEATAPRPSPKEKSLVWFLAIAEC